MKRKIGIGVEGLIHKKFASLIYKYETYNKLNCEWWSYDASGEKRNAITGSLLKSKGLKSGKADYEFIMIKNNIAYYIYIEFKKPKTENSVAGKQSKSQKEFEIVFENVANVNYYVCYSVQDAIDILIKNKFIEL